MVRSGLLAAAMGVSAMVSTTQDNAPLEPVSVCDVFRDLAANSGKTLVVLGRFSFRPSGRSLSEGRCANLAGGENGAVLEVVFDPKSAPKPSGELSVPAAAVYQKLNQVKISTQLGKLHFGSPDYDRWALVFGRVEESAAAKPDTAARPETAAKPEAAAKPAGSANQARHARLVSSGEALVMFVAEP